jgi:hypothetical protein
MLATPSRTDRDRLAWPAERGRAFAGPLRCWWLFCPRPAHTAQASDKPARLLAFADRCRSGPGSSPPTSRDKAASCWLHLRGLTAAAKRARPAERGHAAPAASLLFFLRSPPQHATAQASDKAARLLCGALPAPTWPACAHQQASKPRKRGTGRSAGKWPFHSAALRSSFPFNIKRSMQTGPSRCALLAQRFAPFGFA